MKAEAVLRLMKGEVDPPPCGTPLGTLIKRWNSVSRGRASVCLGSDIFNLGPYEQQATPTSFSLAFVKSTESTSHRSQDLTKGLVQNLIMGIFEFDTTFEAYTIQTIIGQV